MRKEIEKLIKEVDALLRKNKIRLCDTSIFLKDCCEMCRDMDKKEEEPYA